MTKKELISKYVRKNGFEGKGSNLVWDGKKLVNYNTTIAYHLEPCMLLLNNQFYSKTTTTNQNMLRREALSAGMEVLECDEKKFNEILRSL